MSIIKKGFSHISLGFIAILMLCYSVSAQDFEAKITVLPDSSRVEITGKLLKSNSSKPVKNWAFKTFAGGAENYGERISDLKLTGENGVEISYKKLADGEYLANGEALKFEYKVQLKPTQYLSSKAHFSWLEGEQGSFMPGDILPLLFHENNQPFSAKLYFELPEDWKIIGAEKKQADNSFFIENFEDSVFAVGKNWRENEFEIEDFQVNLTLFGDWRFSDKQAVAMTKEILRDYQTVFGNFPKDKAQIFLVPVKNKFGRWEAETRGSNLTIVSGDMPFETQSLQRLHEQLRHELFHLWIPNDLALTGNYAWFYEGFTVYWSLKTAIAANRIRFEDFLDTIGQAFNLTSFSDERISLIELSKNQLDSSNPQVYSKGMLVAFLCDIAILQESRGRRSISEIFREVYQKHKMPNEKKNGNEAIAAVLKNKKELRPLIEKYIEGAEKFDWQTDLESVGIEAETENSFVKLRVKSKLSGRQKDLLNRLGYNNWRKMQKKLK